jgi:two-component system, chemotaxis family, sensor kinase CheA
MTNDIELDEIRNEFIDESIDGLSGAADSIIAIEKDPHDKEVIAGIFRTVHSIKGNAAFFELMALKNLAHRLEDVLSGIRNDLIYPESNTANLLLEAIDALTALLFRVREGRPEVEDAEMFNELIKRLNNISKFQTSQGGYINRLRLKLASLSAIPNVAINRDAKRIIDDLIQTLNEIGEEEEKDIPRLEAKTAQSEEPDIIQEESSRTETVESTATTPQGNAKQVQKTMRIREESIDGFFKFVGELVVVGEMYDHVYSRLRRGELDGSAMQLRQANESFRMLSTGLQQSILEIRKVPGKQLLGRVSRIVRDVCTQTGKEANIVLKGEDLMIDKAVAEALEAPLVHIVRNAVDHGIELPEARVQSKKPRHGTVTVSLSAIENMIQLSVSDDGKGIDEEKLRKKAIDSGLIDAQRTLSKDDIVNLLFQSGMSTAETVTDISGRGVGMDVVKREIEEMGGDIDIESRFGHGSTFQLCVPATVTTRIIQGIGIFSDGNRYIVPVESVVRFFEFTSSQIHSIGMDHRSIHLNGQTFPFAKLSDILQTANTMRGDIPRAGIGVLVSKGAESVAIQVDEVEANRQLVMKETEGVSEKNALFRGAAITGDGTVSLVLDSSSLIDEITSSTLNY